MDHVLPPPAAGDWSVVEVPSKATFIFHRQPLTTRTRRHCNCANDLRLLSDLVLGVPSLTIDHRIMLDVEFVLGLALLS
jgi:hypothetical protein